MPYALSISSPSRLARAVIGGGLLGGLMVFGSAANAALSFSFDYSGNTPGVGFEDPTTGADRKAALETAGMLFSNMFGTFFDHTATIVLGATSTDDPLGPVAER